MALTPQQQDRIAAALIADFNSKGMNPDAIIRQLLKLLLKPRTTQLTTLRQYITAAKDDVQEAVDNQAQRVAEETTKFTAVLADYDAALTDLV